MCELLVRARDKPLTGDPAVDCQRYRRGDVIAAVPDGWAWSPEELDHPRWFVLRVPGMSLEEGRALASAEPSGQPRVGSRPPRRRFWKRLFTLDLDALGLAAAAGVVTADIGRVRGAKATRPPIEER